MKRGRSGEAGSPGEGAAGGEDAVATKKRGGGRGGEAASQPPRLSSRVSPVFEWLRAAGARGLDDLAVSTAAEEHGVPFSKFFAVSEKESCRKLTVRVSRESEKLKFVDTHF